ncbi:MAG: TSCPD domain-containing protein, partial [Deltaproteobacteria bacterium]|nr:TSCPD domain-containing protein [Deltaproteobacteria bacterium]
EERGPFPNFKGSIYDKPGFKPLRNATTTTIAPTGTISIIAGTSSGIEPLFAIAYVRNVMDNTKLYEINPLFLKVAKEEGFYSDEIIAKIVEKGGVQDVDGIPQRVKRIFRTAHDISPEWHVRMQAAFQKYTDNAVSKTVNLPHSATQEDVKDIYLLAYKLGCKGVTVYRDGSREEQVLSTKKTEVAKERVQQDTARPLKIVPRERPDCVWGVTQKLITGCGNIYITVNEDENGPVELFTAIGKAGGCASSQAEAISRLISLALRAGIEIESIIKQLQGVRCPNPQWSNGEQILSCADAISRAMKMYLERRDSFISKRATPGTIDKIDVKKSQTKGNISSTGERTSITCPECGSGMMTVEGCYVCTEPTCGFSKCL